VEPFQLGWSSSRHAHMAGDCNHCRDGGHGEDSGGNSSCCSTSRNRSDRSHGGHGGAPHTTPAGSHRGLSGDARHRRSRKYRGPRGHRRDAHDGGHGGGTDDSEHRRYCEGEEG
jgi:hypothetical protein